MTAVISKEKRKVENIAVSSTDGSGPISSTPIYDMKRRQNVNSDAERTLLTVASEVLKTTLL